MNTQTNPVGIITACHQGDLKNAKATLESACHFCPSAPLCLIVDGDFDVSEISDSYPGISLLRTTDIDDPFVAAYCRGNPRSKLLAIWHGPFDRFIYLDSDAVMWGDVTKALDWHEEDFLVFWNESNEEAHRSWMSEYYFDVDEVLKRDASFKWKKHPYFSTGAFACRRNFITKEEWEQCEQWRRESPGMFSWTRDQGILNYLIFSKSDAGKLKVGLRDLQWIPVHRGIDETIRRFGAHFKTPPSEVARPYVIHFCGSKPELHRRGGYSAPFTCFRLRFLNRMRRAPRPVLLFLLWLEELPAIHKRCRSRIQRLFR